VRTGDGPGWAVVTGGHLAATVALLAMLSSCQAVPGTEAGNWCAYSGVDGMGFLLLDGLGSLWTVEVDGSGAVDEVLSAVPYHFDLWAEVWILEYDDQAWEVHSYQPGDHLVMYDPDTLEGAFWSYTGDFDRGTDFAAVELCPPER